MDTGHPVQPAAATRQDPPAPAGAGHAVRTLVALAALVVLLGGVWVARGVLGPAVLGAVVVVVVHPLRYPLDRRGWPRWAANTVVIAAGWLVLALIVGLIVFAFARFGVIVADYGPQLQSSIDDVTSWLSSIGLHGDATDAAAQAVGPSAVLHAVRSVGASTVSLLSALFFVFAYVLFMAVDGGRYTSARALFGGERRAAIDRTVRLTADVRRYYVVSTVFGAIVAVLDGIALWLLGVPGAVVWAILAFVTNYVPNIGFVLGLIPPAVLGLVVGGWPTALGVIAIYCVVNMVLQVFIQPKFESDAVDLSLTLSFASVTFWTLVIGPVGAVLSIPLTLLLRALLLEPDPSTRWLRWLTGDQQVAAEQLAAAGRADESAQAAGLSSPTASAPPPEEQP